MILNMCPMLFLNAANITWKDVHKYKIINVKHDIYDKKINSFKSIGTCSYRVWPLDGSKQSLFYMCAPLCLVEEEDAYGRLIAALITGVFGY